MDGWDRGLVGGCNRVSGGAVARASCGVWCAWRFVLRCLRGELDLDQRVFLNKKIRRIRFQRYKIQRTIYVKKNI